MSFSKYSISLKIMNKSFVLIIIPFYFCSHIKEFGVAHSSPVVGRILCTKMMPAQIFLDYNLFIFSKVGLMVLPQSIDLKRVSILFPIRLITMHCC
jgi:hypothetical protein